MTRTRTAGATSHVARSTWQAARSTSHVARRTFTALLLVALGASAARAQDPQTNGWVVLSLDEYRALRARAFPVPPAPNPPPVDAALTRVDYDLRANGDTVSGEARLTVDVLKQGWVSIQAPAGVSLHGALERTADGARRRHASAGADLECRTRDADARHRRPNRDVRRDRIDDPSCVAISAFFRAPHHSTNQRRARQ